MIQQPFELEERINLKRLEFLNSLTLEQLNEFPIRPATDESVRQIRKLYEESQPGAGNTIRKYRHGKTSGGKGRLYASGGIQNLNREARGLLMQGSTTDVDMTNCHPIIL